MEVPHLEKEIHYLILPKGKNKKVIRLMKGKLGVKIMTTFVVLKAKSYIYLTDDNSEDKKIKGTKKCAMKRKCEFENYRNFLEALNLIIK